MNLQEQLRYHADRIEAKIFCQGVDNTMREAAAELDRLAAENRDLRSLKWYSTARELANIVGVHKMSDLPDRVRFLVRIEQMFSEFNEQQAKRTKE